VKIKAYMTIKFVRLLVFLALFAGLAVTTFGQEDPLQGAWFDDDRFLKMTLYNGRDKVVIRGRPQSKGNYTVVGNEVTWKSTHIHSNAFDGMTSRYGWFSREEMYAEFGSRFNSWFEPVTQTFFINGDILTLVSDLSEQQFTRMQK